jgi:hypothetical protein
MHVGITTYHTVALREPDLGDLLDRFPERLERYPVHACSHPPGAILLYRTLNRAWERAPEAADAAARALVQSGLAPPLEPWADEAAREAWQREKGWAVRSPRGLTAGALAGAFTTGHLLILLASLSLLPLFAFLRRAWGEDAAAAGLPWAAVVPAPLLMNALLDQLYLLWIPVCLLAVLAAVRKRSPAWGAAAGLLLAIGIFVTFTFLVVGVGVAAFAGLAALAASRARGPRRLAEAARRLAASAWDLKLPLAAGLAALVLPYLVLGMGAGFDLFETFRVANERAYHEQVVALGRTYRTWVVWNLYDFCFLLGWPVAALAAARAWGEGRRLASGAATDPGDAARTTGPTGAPLALTVAVVLLFLDLSGKTLGETGRIWMFLMPWAAAAAGWRVRARPRMEKALLLGTTAAFALVYRFFLEIP